MQTGKAIASCLLLALMLGVKAVSAQSNTVVRDGNVAISEAEMKAMIEAWTDDMRRAAATDKGERFELLTSAIMSRKMAQEAEEAKPGDPGYWEMQFKLLGIKQRYVFDRFLETLDIPDMEDLARERYETEKDKYARVPEHRKASHILFRCAPGKCNRDELRPIAQEVLDALRAGADFEAMVAEHSQDPRSKARGGALTDWIRLGDKKVIPEFAGGLFEIEEVGGYSDVTDTRFGLHIIRFDERAPSFYQPYERVKDVIIRDLENEYKQLAAREFRRDYHFTNDAFIDGEAMDRLFAPYVPEGAEIKERDPSAAPDEDILPGEFLGGDDGESN